MSHTGSTFTYNRPRIIIYTVTSSVETQKAADLVGCGSLAESDLVRTWTGHHRKSRVYKVDLEVQKASQKLAVVNHFYLATKKALWMMWSQGGKGHCKLFAFAESKRSSEWESSHIPLIQIKNNEIVINGRAAINHGDYYILNFDIVKKKSQQSEPLISLLKNYPKIYLINRACLPLPKHAVTIIPSLRPGKPEFTSPDMKLYQMGLGPQIFLRPIHFLRLL